MANDKNHQDMLVVGLGKTGLSCVRYLLAEGYSVRVADSRAQPPGLETLKQEFPQVEFQGGEFDSDYFCAANDIVLSPGVALSTQAVQAAIKKGTKCYGDVEIFAQHAVAPIIAITGSNGKSTLVTLLAEMIKASGKTVGLGGNIGTPVLDLLQQSKQQHFDFYVLELSSFQLETTSSLNALASIILNVSPDHMDRYTDVQAYANAKQRIYSGDGDLVVNLDDELAQDLLPPTLAPHRKVISYSVTHEADYNLCSDKYRERQLSLCKLGSPLMALNELKMPGLHNASNALAALALGDIMQLDPQAMISVLKSFPGLAHRTQFVAEHKTVRWYNDSKGTNVGATCAAVQGMEGKSILIAGGEAKQADFSELVAVLERKARAVILIGRDANLIEDAIKDRVPVTHASDMQDAVQQAATAAQAGDSVLLSPACASFDMYSNFEQRGDSFMQAVKDYIAADNGDVS